MDLTIGSVERFDFAIGNFTITVAIIVMEPISENPLKQVLILAALVWNQSTIETVFAFEYLMIKRHLLNLSFLVL
jgi:hypothetical protein